MKWKKSIAFMFVDVFLGAIGAALVHFIGEEQCNTQQWQDELYMYILHQRKLEMCLSSTGGFHLGLEAVAEWMPYRTPLPLAILMLMMMLIMPMAFSRMCTFVSNVVDRVLEKLMKKHNNVNQNADAFVIGHVDISFDFATVEQLMRNAAGKNVDIVLDYDVILDLMKYAVDGDVEIVVDP
ncbi:hypothetical protein ScPMuIL_018556 [Solemya velum]